MPVYQLPSSANIFPHPLVADPSGLLAIGGDLHPDRLLLAYRYGIFPWYNKGEPIIWWYPNPRCVLFPANVKVSKSMRSYFNQFKYRVSYDQNFYDVISKCRKITRPGQEGTWIHQEMIDAFHLLHQMGMAHSVEVWDQEDQLVGGLYGLAIGKIFFGESMFAVKSNASKFGLISLARKLNDAGFVLIDCQQDTPHMRSMGAELLSAYQFYKYCQGNLFSVTENIFA